VRKPIHTYRHALFDSSRWDGFRPRDGDIVIATSLKAGTTWMQGIVASLLWPHGDAPGFFGELSPFLDARWVPIQEVLTALEAQPHRRFIKTHTAADGIPIHDNVRYIVVGRDGRDVFMSLVNHWEKMRPRLIQLANELSGPDVPDLPPWHGDVHRFFDEFISRGSFPWEGDGAPWWSHFHHCATWWELRDRANVLFIHYNEMLVDVERVMREVAEFCNIEVEPDAWAGVVERVRIDNMREEARKAQHHDRAMIGGASSFFFKGTNGRWRDVLTPAELARYEQRVREVLPVEAVHWLEHGRWPSGT
jgi:aryl sulfotransferase